MQPFARGGGGIRGWPVHHVGTTIMQPRVVECLRCKGTTILATRRSPRRASGGALVDTCANAEGLHFTCICPFTTGGKSAISAEKKCLLVFRRTCCLLGLGNAILEPSKDAWLALQVDLDAPCPDCGVKNRRMYNCNAFCCSRRTNACYGVLRGLLGGELGFPLDARLLSPDHQTAFVNILCARG